MTHSRLLPVATITSILLVLWYIFTFIMNAPFQRDQDQRDGVTSTFTELVAKTMRQPKPTMPAPHQVAQNLYKNIFTVKPTSQRSLVYHAGVTLSSTLLGFLMGTVFGILIAVGIVHIPALERSFLPWIIASQTIPDARRRADDYCHSGGRVGVIRASVPRR